MPKLAKQISAIAGPLLLLTISTTIYFRYSEGAGPEVFIAVAIGAVLVSMVLVSLNSVRLSRRAAQEAGRELENQYPKSHLMLAEFDRRAVRALQARKAQLSESVKQGLFVLRIEPDRVEVFSVQDLQLLGSLVVGLDLLSFNTTSVNRGNAYSEPSLRLSFIDGQSVELILYEVSTGKWPSREALSKLPGTA